MCLSDFRIFFGVLTQKGKVLCFSYWEGKLYSGGETGKLVYELSNPFKLSFQKRQKTQNCKGYDKEDKYVISFSFIIIKNLNRAHHHKLNTNLIHHIDAGNKVRVLGATKVVLADKGFLKVLIPMPHVADP